MAVKIREKNGRCWLLPAGSLLTLVAISHADSIQEWRTPSGSSYFGDRPPAGSTLVGETESLGTSGGGETSTTSARMHSDAVRASKRLKPDREKGMARDSHGRIKRSSTARMEFLRSQGLARTPVGCQVDHIVPLSKGGPDVPGNMQLLCGEALREKEATERR